MLSTLLIATGGSWLTFLLSVCLFLAVLALLLQRGRFLYALKNIPRPFALPILGNTYQLSCSPEEFFERLVKWSREFGDIYLVWVGMRPFVFLYRVEAVQPLLSSSVHIDKSLEYKYLKSWLGDGLITSTGEKWHFRRKLLTPTFHSNLLEEYLRSAKREIRVMIACLEKEVGKVFDVVPYAKRATLDVICDCAMGYRVNAQTNISNEYVTAVNSVASIVQKRFTNIWLSIEPIFQLSKWGKEYNRSLRIIHHFVDKVITDRKLEWNRKKDKNFNGPPKKRQVLLDLLLEMSEDGKLLTDEDIRDEVNTFMFAGHDTLATSISWVLYALGHRPEYQEKILQQYDSLIGDNEVTMEQLNKLVWLDACIKETWRIYPVAPLIARQICAPINLMGHNIPKGSTVLINSFLLHRDARFFPEPEVYKPERFLPNAPKLPCYAFIPFSAGSRNCIGWRFATIVLKIFVLSMLKSFHVEAVDSEDKLQFISELVLVSKGGLRLRIVPRIR